MQVELKVGVMRSAGMESEVVGVSVSWMISGERAWISIGNGKAERSAIGVDAEWVKIRAVDKRPEDGSENPFACFSYLGLANPK